eukprot:scaffold316789_cov31-Tisochrysis_lutea.AAC.3
MALICPFEVCSPWDNNATLHVLILLRLNTTSCCHHTAAIDCRLSGIVNASVRVPCALGN